AVAAAVSPLISAATTCAPSRAKPSAMARPIPEPEAVTTAVLFCRSPGMVPFLQLRWNIAASNGACYIGGEGESDVPQHQDLVQFRAAGHRSRNPGVGAAFCAQALGL